MRRADCGLLLALIVMAPVSQGRAGSAGTVEMRVGEQQVIDERMLKAHLLDLAQERLPAGFEVHRERASLSLSSALPATDRAWARPLWSVDDGVPALPLVFELSTTSPDPPFATSRSKNPTIRATLAVPLLREVWVAARRLRKGSVVSCLDLAMERRDTRHLPRLPMAGPCETESGAVALRDIAAGEVLRSADIGTAPDVMAGAPVYVSVARRGISVTATARALADARVGDQIDVRLQSPSRLLKARVIAPGWVAPLDERP